VLKRDGGAEDGGGWGRETRRGLRSIEAKLILRLQFSRHGTRVDRSDRPILRRATMYRNRE